MTAPQTTSASYEVGYRKPPRHTQFQKGQSGNPGGRPRRPARRLDELALYEAYRTTVVMEDGHAMPMPAIQAVLRSQLQSAASGNVRAQRDILAMIRDIERVRSITSLFDNGGADDVVDDTDDADAIDADDNDDDDTDDADRDDAGGADDDEPERQQADGIDTHAERRQEEREPAAPLAVSAPHPENAAAPPAGLHPTLKGEGRIAEGDPGWGGGGAGDDDDAAYAEALSPPPGPLTRADLPPAEPRYSEGSATQQSDRSRQQPTSVGGGEEATSFAPAGRTPPLPSGQRRGVLPRRNGRGRSAGVQPARPQPGRRRSGPAVNPGKIRGGRSGGLRRSPSRTKSGPGPAEAAGGHARAPAAPAERGEKLKTRC
jgi:Family of unknown function (DUF5681)